MIRQSRNTVQPLNDGIMYYGKVETTRDAQRKETGKIFKEIGQLCFQYKELSTYDVTLYQGITSGENIKIKTYYIPDVELGLKVKINNVTYDITGTNADDDRSYRYWVLQRVKA